jgi:hypothetical protein
MRQTVASQLRMGSNMVSIILHTALARMRSSHSLLHLLTPP